MTATITPSHGTNDCAGVDGKDERHNALTLSEFEKIVHDHTVVITYEHVRVVLNQEPADFEHMKRYIRGLLKERCPWNVAEDIVYEMEDTIFVRSDVLCQKGDAPRAYQLPIPNAYCASISYQIAASYPSLFQESCRSRVDEFTPDRHGHLTGVPLAIRRMFLEKLIHTCADEMKQDHVCRQAEAEAEWSAARPQRKRARSLDGGTIQRKKAKTGKVDGEIAAPDAFQKTLASIYERITDSDLPDQGSEAPATGQLCDNHTAWNGVQDASVCSPEMGSVIEPTHGATQTAAPDSQSAVAPDRCHHGKHAM